MSTIMSEEDSRLHEILLMVQQGDISVGFAIKLIKKERN